MWNTLCDHQDATLHNKSSEIYFVWPEKSFTVSDTHTYVSNTTTHISISIVSEVRIYFSLEICPLQNIDYASTFKKPHSPL